MKLTPCHSSEHGSKLSLLLDASKLESGELMAQKELLDSLKADQKIELAALDDLRRLFILPEQVIEEINRDRILNALKFDYVSSDKFLAAKDTLSWCLYDEKIPESHPDLKMSFRSWLAEGKGIFHISGKMGSGKSTLMR
jgi:hypothetical protein